MKLIFVFSGLDWRKHSIDGYAVRHVVGADQRSTVRHWYLTQLADSGSLHLAPERLFDSMSRAAVLEHRGELIGALQISNDIPASLDALFVKRSAPGRPQDITFVREALRVFGLRSATYRGYITIESV